MILTFENALKKSPSRGTKGKQRGNHIGIFGSLVHITGSEHIVSPELKHSHSER